ncbi:hypothetical protein K1T71_010156 [Dendrolimus kikuchii]|uniref:Uncharacterized protein n=1 Tax=Dendrolimus kikuchii TaxID=765133 RepID=A0ACC1CR05_9NEOP|nr:hypothetical protein K1T71_010156 [Dendrolimus kikuchii]
MNGKVKKRQRSENWLDEDKTILKTLVKEWVHEIENKNTDTTSNSKKVAAWNDLQESFNCMCKGAPRTVAQLKAQWCLIKLQAKKTKGLDGKQILKIEGSPPPKANTDAVNNEDIRLLNEFTVNFTESDEVNQVQTPSITVLTDHVYEHKNTLLNATLSISLPTSTIDSSMYRKMQNANTPAEQVAANEIECRRELHYIQMENERKKNENLILEEILLKQKIEYYVKKNQNINNLI